jgi:hypothetical protein
LSLTTSGSYTYTPNNLNTLTTGNYTDTFTLSSTNNTSPAATQVFTVNITSTNNTINNTGTINNSSMSTFNNPGIIINESSSIINNAGTFVNGSGTNFNNSGLLTNNTGANFNNSGSLTNNSGGVFLNNGTITNNSGSSFSNNGTLAGFGTYNGNFNLVTGANLSPGGSITGSNYSDTNGTFNINGALTLNGGSLNISVAGINTNEHDNLLISQAAALNSGKISFSINDINNINSAIPVGTTQSIPIFTASSGITLTSTFIKNILVPASTTQDVFKLSKVGNTLNLNVTHIS